MLLSFEIKQSKQSQPFLFLVFLICFGQTLIKFIMTKAIITLDHDGDDGISSSWVDANDDTLKNVSNCVYFSTITDMIVLVVCIGGGE